MSELAPATLEGWFALHQMMRIDRSALRRQGAAAITSVLAEIPTLLASLAQPTHGWSGVYRLVGGSADIMFIHFRETLDELAAAEHQLRSSALGEYLQPTHDFLSITEAGLYHATAEAAREAKPGSKEYQQVIDDVAAAERASAHVQTRLFPQPPAPMRYVSFYPMSKRRTHPDNWYALPIDERNRLMREHGLTGRRYAGRVFQVITGAVGLDDWEWGVTLFAADPLEFKRIVTEMRYDEASAKYGEFGQFWTGIRLDADGLSALI